MTKGMPQASINDGIRQLLYSLTTADDIAKRNSKMTLKKKWPLKLYSLPVIFLDQKRNNNVIKAISTAIYLKKKEK